MENNRKNINEKKEHKGFENEALTDFEEEIVENNVEGKTWNTTDRE
ncbi:hypothetical protein [Radiobacillus sp. PE A8.2]